MADQQGMVGRLVSAMGSLGRVVRGDSWQNTVTGVGTNYRKNAMVFTPSLADYLADEELARLYELDGIAARIVDAVPKHAMRHQPTVSVGDAATSAAVKARLDDLGAWQAMQDAWCWARLFGGGAVFVGADDGRDPALPLDAEHVSRVRFLVTADRRDLQPQAYHEDPLSSRYSTPATYRLMRQGGTSTSMATVHASRLIRFDGVPTTKRRRLELQGWNDSVLQRVRIELQAARAAFAGAGTLLQEASVTVVGIKGLMGLMGSDPTDTLKTRFDVMQRMMSIGRWLLLDAEGETASRLEVGALTGVVDVMDRFVAFLAAVSGIPVTVLMGQAPAGLNATGEADIRSWYDEVAAERERVLRPALEGLIRLILRSSQGPTGGVEPEGWRIDFPPLWQPTPSEQADLRAKVATTDTAYITAGVLTPEEVALSRFRPDGWSAETEVDLDARRAALEASLAGEGEVPEGEQASQDAEGSAQAPAVDHEAVAAILGRVAAREIPRTSGLAMLAQLGLDPDAVEATMGETGVSFFTAPEPGHAAELDAARAQVAKLTRSRDGVRGMLSRVLERNRAGELVVGRLIARAPTDTEEGDVLEEGDTVPVDPAQGGA